MKLQLKRWVKVVLLVYCFYLIISMFTIIEVIEEEGKDYTCFGSKIFQVCSGETYE